MLKVSHKELAELIKEYYDKKVALLIRGRFGIGKTAVTYQVGKDISKEKNREFAVWNKLTAEEKAKLFEHPEKYFVFIDIRLSEYDCSDIKGLPVFKDDKKSIEFKVPYWALLLEKENSDGILFFDEINLAPPLVMSSCYKIIYDRVINESKINNNWLIIGAGNLDEDRAYTHDIAPPLKDRCGEVELMGANSDEWINNFAIPNNINSLIIGFIAFKNSAIYKVDFDDNQKFTTHRGWERVSKLIENVPKNDYDKLSLISQSAIGEGIGQEFTAFCKINEQIKMAEIINNPEKLRQLKELNVKWFVITAMAEHYKENKMKIDKIMEASKILDSMNEPEFVAYLWKLCYGFKKAFKDEFIKKVDNELVKKYAKFLI